MNKKIVIGNWKLHLSVPESTVLIEKLKKELGKVKNTEVVICPSFIDIYPASKELQDSEIGLGAQNMFYEAEGAFTGEVSPHALSYFVKYVIVGHSERRKYFGESDITVAKKAEAAFAHDITPIICVGETLHENRDGLSKVVVMNQVEAALSHLTGEEVAKVIIAYEPVWAIGTGEVCKPSDAEKMIVNIRNLVKAIYGEDSAKSVRIIYGGSVNADTIKQFAKSEKIDGYLIGGASVDPKNFAAIVSEVDKKDNSKKSKVESKKVKGSK